MLSICVPPPDGNGIQLSFSVVTETGMELVGALRRPTSLSYLCWLQRHFGEQGVVAEIWSVTPEEFEGSHRHFPVSKLPDACGTIESMAE